MELPKVIKTGTHFHSDILRRIYNSIDSAEISTFDTVRVQQRNKAISIIEVLNQEQIDIRELRREAFYGVPDTNKTGQADLRSIVWRVLLGVLPLQPVEWESSQQQNLMTYMTWRQELIVTADDISKHYSD